MSVHAHRVRVPGEVSTNDILTKITCTRSELMELERFKIAKVKSIPRVVHTAGVSGCSGRGRVHQDCLLVGWGRPGWWAS